MTARRAILRGIGLIAMMALSACTTVIARAPAPEALIDEARPYGIESDFLRGWGDAVDEERIAYLVRRRVDQLKTLKGLDLDQAATLPDNYALALSGGGPDGAFGAGVLAGWSARGDRPEFAIVSGVSTGAIVALFAYLGSDYDAALREIYTTYRTEDLLTPTIFTGLTGGSAVTDTRGYRRLIDRYVDEEIMAEIAQRYAEGRVLLIGTTNLDAARPVVWNIGEIAASGHPRALDLIRDVVQASSAIPAAFPPVLIPVEAQGQRFDEMHVDGGATRQVMLLSPQFRRSTLEAVMGRSFRQRLYVIINNKLTKRYRPVSPRLASIAERALGSLLSGSGSGDLYRLFAVAARDGVDLNVMAIPKDLDLEAAEAFDPDYMSALYQVGFEAGQKGDAWLSHPPDFTPEDCTRPARRRIAKAFCK